MSIAGFLLCLLGTYAISPVDYFLRTQVGSRGRAVRTCRLDDHDHQDHALDVVSLALSSLDSHGADGTGADHLAVITQVRQLPLVASAAFKAAHPVLPLFSRISTASAGRAPPQSS